MKKQLSKINATISAAAIPLALSLPLAVFAAETAKTSPAIAGPTSIQSSAKNAEAHEKKVDTRKEIVKEAADAARATQSALKALESNKPKEALAALEVVSGNLHLLLSRDPALGMVPVDFQVQILEGTTDLKVIKRLEDELDDLIDDKHYQAARPIIDSLVDEIRVTTVYLPIATYPAAIDRVAPLIDAGKLDEAKKELYSILNTLVSEQEITPLSIIRAEEKLSEAFQVEHKNDLSKQETKDKIANLVYDANHQIDVAQTLGYGTKADYEVLYESMDALKKSIGTAGFKGEWLKIKESLSTFKNKIVHPHK